MVPVFYYIKLIDHILSIVQRETQAIEKQIRMHYERKPPDNERINLNRREGDSNILFQCFPT